MKRQKLRERAGRHPLLTTTLLVASTAGGLMMDGYLKNDTAAIPSGSCVSPYRVSDTYRDRGAITLLQTDTGILTSGVVVVGFLPNDSYGEQPAYRNPDQPGAEWNNGAMVTTGNNHTGYFAMKMAIGSGPVEFGVRTVAPDGSASCATAPDLSFDYVSEGEYFTTRASIPWEWPVNVATNALGGLVHAVAKFRP